MPVFRRLLVVCPALRGCFSSFSPVGFVCPRLFLGHFPCSVAAFFFRVFCAPFGCFASAWRPGLFWFAFPLLALCLALAGGSRRCSVLGASSRSVCFPLGVAAPRLVLVASSCLGCGLVGGGSFLWFLFLPSFFVGWPCRFSPCLALFPLRPSSSSWLFLGGPVVGLFWVFAAFPFSGRLSPLGFLCCLWVLSLPLFLFCASTPVGLLRLLSRAVLLLWFLFIIIS